MKTALPCVALLLVTALSACEGAMGEPVTGVARTCFMDVGGDAKECHEEAASSSREFETMEVKVRCWQTEEGPLVNCVMLRGPHAVELDILANAKKARVPPKILNGKPVEGWVLLGYRMRFVDRR